MSDSGPTVVRQWSDRSDRSDRSDSQGSGVQMGRGVAPGGLLGQGVQGKRRGARAGGPTYNHTCIYDIVRAGKNEDLTVNARVSGRVFAAGRVFRQPGRTGCRRPMCDEQ